MELIIIAAISENNVIGVDGDLPWRLKKDMAHFKELTMGHPCVMGRKTYESIPQKFRPLPGRENIIMTRDANYDSTGITVVHCLEEALDACYGNQKAFICGGEDIYRQAMPYATSLEITHVHRTIENGTAFFPDIEDHWKEVRREDFEKLSFVRYER